MDNNGERETVEITARFPATLLGTRFPYYCLALGISGVAIMAFAIVVGSVTK